MSQKHEEKVRLPHHEQQPLCTTRPPYRQGRKLTAVKVYTVTDESPHLLIFGVPSLNLRQETKSLLSRYGTLKQFHISPTHAAEPFTETYHANFHSIQSARVAKRMVDTKNFYGGSLHVCYAPELETLEETKQKLIKRRQDVLNRLKNLQREALGDKKRVAEKKIQIQREVERVHKTKTLVDMSIENTIHMGNSVRNIGKHKRKTEKQGLVSQQAYKRFKPVFEDDNNEKKSNSSESRPDLRVNSKYTEELTKGASASGDIEIIDFTSTEKETLSNINEALNYNKFGNEVIRKVPEKPPNKIKFTVGSINKLI